MNKISSSISSDSSCSSENGEAKENENPSVEDMPIKEQLLTQFSWFSVLWKCESGIKLDVPDSQSKDKNRKVNQDKVQFLVYYKFEENQSHKSTDVSVIGMLSNKMERDSYWFSPTNLNSQNDIQGQLFDEIHDANLLRNSDMQEKA